VADEAIADLVEQAFPLECFSDAALLFVHPSRPEEEEAFQVIRGLTWKDMDIDTVLRVGDALLLTSSYGFAQLLPAYLLAMRTAKGQQFALDELVMDGMAPPESKSFLGDLRFWQSISDELSDKQKRAVLTVFFETAEKCTDKAYRDNFEEVVRCLKDRGWPGPRPKNGGRQKGQVQITDDEHGRE